MESSRSSHASARDGASGYNCSLTAPIVLPPPLPPPPPAFRFSTAHSDHMVLQAAPLQAAVWGFCEPGDEVTIRFNTAALPTKLSTVNGSTIWSVALPVTKASFSAYTIDAHSKLSDKTISLSDVLFGDVWLCSGQSNSAILSFPLVSTRSILAYNPHTM